MLNRFARQIRDVRTVGALIDLAADPAFSAWSDDRLAVAALAAEGRELIAAGRPGRTAVADWRARAWATLRVMALIDPQALSACIEELSSASERRRVRRGLNLPAREEWPSAPLPRMSAPSPQLDRSDRRAVGVGS